MNIRKLLPKFIRKWQFDRAVEGLKVALDYSGLEEEQELFNKCVNIYKEYWYLEDE